MIIFLIIRLKNIMFWTKEENDKLSNIMYVALAIDFDMNIEPYLYQYNHIQNDMYRISYSGHSCNSLHRLLKFKLQKRFVVIENDDDMLSIVGHYDDQIALSNNQMIVDLQSLSLKI